MSNVILEVRDLTTKYVTRYQEDVYAVDGVSLPVEEGKTLGIAGESGCGKSTLALSLMGYYFPPLHYTGGEIIINMVHPEPVSVEIFNMTGGLIYRNPGYASGQVIDISNRSRGSYLVRITDNGKIIIQKIIKY